MKQVNKPLLLVSLFYIFCVNSSYALGDNIGGLPYLNTQHIKNNPVSQFDIIDAPDHSVINNLSDVSNDPYQLHTLTYNIKYPPPRTSSPVRAAKIGQALKTINNNYDVIALQECFFQLYYEDIQNNSKLVNSAYNYASNIVGYPSSFIFHDSGGAVFLSKWPIIHEWQHIFSKITFDDGVWRQQKGVIAIEINKGGQHYYFVTTHLSPYEKHSDVRATQLAEINTFIKNNLTEAYPIIFMGDLNIIQGSTEEKNISQALPTLQYVPYSGYYQYSWDAILDKLADDGQQYTIDYLYYWNDILHKKPLSEQSTIVRPVENGATDLSDHFAVQGTFKFN